MNDMIHVVLLEPGKPARPAEIEGSLRAMQRVVGGNIEALYFPEDTVCIVCNESGKINGLPLNRAVRSEGPEREILDIIAGRCFICDCSGEDFGSLSEEQMQRHLKKFKDPEMFFLRDGTIEAIPVKADEKQVDMTYQKMKACFRAAEQQHQHLTGYIVFSPASFQKSYSLESRTYEVSSENKAFIPGRKGYSIYASALDGSDSRVRIDQYMASEHGGTDGWQIERCYMSADEAARAMAFLRKEKEMER